MDLSEQLEHLDVLLLTSVTTAFPAPLPDREKAAVNAYLVMAHAVLEEYVEDVFERHYNTLSGWLGATMVPLEAARFSFAIADWLPDDKRVSYKARSLQGMAKAGREYFLLQVRANHGITPDNIRSLAKYVGLDWKAFEAELNAHLADLNSLASKRGEAGHLSPYTEKAVKITRQTYPENVREWVRLAQEAVVAVDSYMWRLIEDQQPPSLICDWDGN